jgi:hypothetical protein
MFAFGVMSDTQLRCTFGTAYKDITSFDVYARHLIDCNKNVLLIDNVEKGVFETNAFVTTTTLLLGAARHNNTALFPIPKKLNIYSAKIYDNDIIVRDYIPVRMKESNEVGLWDKVHSKFYGNAGTDVFIAGEVAI